MNDLKSSLRARLGAEFLFALKTTMPVFLGYLAIGIAFGLMMAGAGQYLAVGMFSRGASLGEMAVLTLMVNARHMVYGLSLIERFKAWPGRRPYLIFSLTDETYALLTSVRVPEGLDQGRVNTLMAAMDQTWWVMGTMIGAVAGTVLPIPTEGLEFALTALFAVLVVERWKEGSERISFLVGLVCAGLGIVVLGAANMLIPAIVLGIAVLLLIPPAKPELGGTNPPVPDGLARASPAPLADPPSGDKESANNPEVNKK